MPGQETTPFLGFDDQAEEAAGFLGREEGGSGPLVRRPDGRYLQVRMDTTLSFPQVLADARVGRGSALGELFHDLYPRVVRFFRAFEPGRAHDLASDTWIDVVTSLDRFEGDERALRILAFRIARRRLGDFHRRGSRRLAEPTDLDRSRRRAESGDVEDEALAELATREALERIAELPREQAEVVLLRVLGGLTAEDVAGITGLRPSTVREIQHRALNRLALYVSDGSPR